MRSLQCLVYAICKSLQHNPTWWRFAGRTCQSWDSKQVTKILRRLGCSNLNSSSKLICTAIMQDVVAHSWTPAPYDRVFMLDAHGSSLLGTCQSRFSRRVKPWFVTILRGCRFSCSHYLASSSPPARYRYARSHLQATLLQPATLQQWGVWVVVTKNHGEEQIELQIISMPPMLLLFALQSCISMSSRCLRIVRLQCITARLNHVGGCSRSLANNAWLLQYLGLLEGKSSWWAFDAFAAKGVSSAALLSSGLRDKDNWVFPHDYRLL